MRYSYEKSYFVAWREAFFAWNPTMMDKVKQVLLQNQVVDDDEIDSGENVLAKKLYFQAYYVGELELFCVLWKQKGCIFRKTYFQWQNLD